MVRLEIKRRVSEDGIQHHREGGVPGSQQLLWETAKCKLIKPDRIILKSTCFHFKLQNLQ